MATTAESLIGPELTSERVAGGVLPKVLNSFDMVAIFVAIVLFISNVPGFFGNGPVSITWLLVGFITFLIPGAIVTGQLGFLFPGEGSIYLWTHKAFGPFASFFAGFAAWCRRHGTAMLADLVVFGQAIAPPEPEPEPERPKQTVFGKPGPPQPMP